ncbi:replication-relaxation family protein [Ammoniphilus sp. YIM 78166]|uniref:replication-relaxation family protein n=1 Tax=Ammoniphilus sp. YIM 78166 TaxID=1644106 RepID=UPI0010704CD3|nr:replication-relaxation family protein [Ammoniphilus sp. YIM 78166]
MAKPIGPREEQLLIDLYHFVFLDYAFLMKYLYVHEDGRPFQKNYVYRDVKALVNEGYIKMVAASKESGKGGQQAILSLDTKGVEEVREILGEANWDSRWTQRTPTFIHHSLRVAHLTGAFRLAAPSDGLEFMEFISEREGFLQYGNEKKNVIRPDGAFLFRRVNQDKEFHFLYFLEMERSRQKPEVSKEKLVRYNEYGKLAAYAKHRAVYVPINAVRVLFVSDKPNERDRLISHTKEVDTSHLNEVMYSTYEEVLDNPYGSVWKAKNSSDPQRLYMIANRVQ